MKERFYEGLNHEYIKSIGIDQLKLLQNRIGAVNDLLIKECQYRSRVDRI
jgi:hypothetical protein